MIEIKWPKTMPILNGHDMCLNIFHSPCGRRHCLLGHSFVVGDRTSSFVEDAIQDQIAAAITEATNKKAPLIHYFNDHHPCRINAKIWNRAMYLLGYTEGNPQSKPVKVY